MRSFRVFQPNYAHRSLKATSDVSTINIAGKYEYDMSDKGYIVDD